MYRENLIVHTCLAKLTIYSYYIYILMFTIMLQLERKEKNDCMQGTQKNYILRNRHEYRLKRKEEEEEKTTTTTTIRFCLLLRKYPLKFNEY